MMKQKKSQFYFVTMIILLAIALSLILIKPSNTKQNNLHNFFENLDIESEYVLNNAMAEEKDVVDELNYFMGNMKEYGSQQGISFEYFYLIVNETDYIFYNNLINSVEILELETTVNSKETIILDRNQELNKLSFKVNEGIADVNNFIYEFYINNDENQLKYFVIGKRGELYEVRVKDGS